MMMLKIFSAIALWAIFVAIAVLGIILNRREYKTQTESNSAALSGDFTKGYVCMYSVLLVAAGLIIFACEF